MLSSDLLRYDFNQRRPENFHYNILFAICHSQTQEPSEQSQIYEVYCFATWFFFKSVLDSQPREPEEIQTLIPPAFHHPLMLAKSQLI